MTEPTEPSQLFIAELHRAAAGRPGKLAIADDSSKVTFGQLVAEVTERAAALRKAGVEPDDRVAIVAENSVAFLLSAFAVWRAGAVLVTIYPSSSTPDIAFCLRDSDPVLVLADAQTWSAVREAADPDLPVASVRGPVAGQRARRGRVASPRGLPLTLSAICYTSGTTSRPKAIMLSAEGLMNGVRTYIEVWHLTPADTTVVALPMAWLYGLNTTSMATIAAGGTVIALRRARPELIVDAIARYRATWLPGVTTMFVKLVDYLEQADPRPDLSSLRFCLSGGEPRKEPAFERWKRFSGCPVHDVYSATECFPMITYDPASDPEPVSASAGKVVPRSAIRVVGPDGAETGPGEAGEGLWRSPGLMLGYWRDQEQSRAALTPDGWYRSKDLVRVDEQGYVFILGRLSDMIIRGGSNVSPAEVERVLREFPGVRDAAAVGMPDETYGQKVVAALVIDRGTALDHEALREHATARLASYKVPSAYVIVDDLPLNSTTGKVDRREVVASLTRTMPASPAAGRPL